jgi:HAD superfamily hydrolase (TIGR01549 family)
MIDAVIFDLDGTLVTFNLDVNACRNEVIAYLTDQGLPRELYSMKETAFDMLVKTERHIKTRNQNNQESFAEIKKFVWSIVEKHELQSAKQTKLFSGIPETLKTLKDANLKLALCTISGTKAAMFILERFNLAQFFDSVTTRDNVSEVKPHPEHLETALESLGVLPQNTVMVGDSVKDVVCANRVKVMSVGVTTGLSSKEDLVSSGANYIASSANDVSGLIQKLRSIHG